MKPLIKIELRSISTNDRLSEETICYSATLFVDGKIAGHVANRGHGGCDEQHLHPGCDITEIDARCAATYPPLDMSAYKMDNSPADLELVCHRIVEAHSQIKKIRRAMRTKIVVIKGKEILEYGYRGCKGLTEQHFQAFAAAHPNETPINRLPEAQMIAAIEAALS